MDATLSAAYRRGPAGQAFPCQAEALEQLARWQQVRVEAALATLREWRGAAQIIQLYRHYFPRQFARSSARLDVEPGKTYSPLEVEFFDLMHRRLFPLAAWVFDEAEERLDWIPLEAQGVEYEYLDDYRPGLRLLAGLLGVYEDFDWEALRERWPEVPQPVTVEFPGEYVINWAQLIRSCRGAGRLMTDVLATLLVVAGDTGNAWLDTNEEMMSYSTGVGWNVKDMDALAREWKAARKIIVRHNRGVQALETRPKVVARLITFWNRAARKDKASA